MSQITRPFDDALQPGEVVAEVDGARAEVEVVDLDRLGVTVRRVRVTGEDIGVRRAADALPEALRALPDRLAGVEVDPRLGGAVLRSVPADVRRHGDAREFFEARTDGASVVVERARVGQGREVVPWTLTREQLGRIVERTAELFRR